MATYSINLWGKFIVLDFKDICYFLLRIDFVLCFIIEALWTNISWWLLKVGHRKSFCLEYHQKQSNGEFLKFGGNSCITAISKQFFLLILKNDQYYRNTVSVNWFWLSFLSNLFGSLYFLYDSLIYSLQNSQLTAEMINSRLPAAQLSHSWLRQMVFLFGPMIFFFIVSPPLDTIKIKSVTFILISWLTYKIPYEYIFYFMHI